MPWWAVLLLINILLLGVGMFMDPVSAIVIVTPILMPVAQAIGVDPVHFGLILIVNMAIGMFTPPFGLNLFVATSIFNLPMARVVHGLIPFFLLYLLALMLITYIPAISLWLPTLVYR
jgi:C4-dicarboxylate transporter DctM subunit